MKKWILSAVLMLAITGYAAAQKQTTKVPDTTQQKKAKKGTKQNTKNENTTRIIRSDTSAHKAKIKVDLPPADTSGMIPKRKDQ